MYRVLLNFFYLSFLHRLIELVIAARPASRGYRKLAQQLPQHQEKESISSRLKLADAPSKRLCFDYRTGQNSQIDQGAIQCELLTFERGSWGALPIYNLSSETVNGKQIISGYVESQTDQKFRAILTYVHPRLKRTPRWHVDHPLLCSMYVDGRRKAVCEHTITQGAHENPVDLTGCASAYGLPFANVPSEKDTHFSWKQRSEHGEHITTRPPGTAYIDEQSSISFRLSKCEIHKVVRDRSGKAAFPTTEPSVTPGKRDKDFEPTESHHRRLSHYIHIADNDSSSSSVDELVPDFEVVSGPFVEFKFYYKSRELLESLEIARAVRPRRGGLPARKSSTELRWIALHTPSASTSGCESGQTQQRRQPPVEIVQSPSSRTISGRQNASNTSRPTGYTATRAVRNLSPELPTPSQPSAAFKRPSSQAGSASRMPTPYYPRAPATGSPPRKRPATTQVPAAEAPQPQKRQKTTPQRLPQTNDHIETASLPSPPASPVPSTHSDGSLPSLSEILQSRKTPTTKQQSPTRPFTGTNMSGGHARSPSRVSPSRPLHSPSALQQATTPSKRFPLPRPPLIPGVRNTAVRKEPSVAESNATRLVILGRAPDSAPARQTTQAAPVPPIATPPVSGSGPSTSRAKARPSAPAPLPTPDATAPSTSTTLVQASAPLPSSPEQKPNLASLIAAAPSPTPTPQAGPSTPQAAAPVASTSALAVAKSEQITPPKVEHTTPSRSGKSTARRAVQAPQGIIDLTMDSEAEEDQVDQADQEDREAREEESKKDIIASSTAATAANKVVLEKRKSAHDNAVEFLTRLDIDDVENIDVLIKVGFKSEETFVSRLAKLAKDDEYRVSIIKELQKEMGKLDFALLRAFLRSKDLDVDY